MIYTVHHGVTCEQRGEAETELQDAIAFAKTLSQKEFRHSWVICQDGKVIKFALAGSVYDEPKENNHVL
jgi:hypothetical protein